MMNAESAFPDGCPEPPYPLGQMTTSELDRYRRELEHAVNGLPAHATYLPVLRGRLADVTAEQAARDRLAAANGAPP